LCPINYNFNMTTKYLLENKDKLEGLRQLKYFHENTFVNTEKHKAYLLSQFKEQQGFIQQPEPSPSIEEILLPIVNKYLSQLEAFVTTPTKDINELSLGLKISQVINDLRLVSPFGKEILTSIKYLSLEANNNVTPIYNFFISLSKYNKFFLSDTKGLNLSEVLRGRPFLLEENEVITFHSYEDTNNKIKISIQNHIFDPLEENPPFEDLIQSMVGALEDSIYAINTEGIMSTCEQMYIVDFEHAISYLNLCLFWVSPLFRALISSSINLN